MIQKLNSLTERRVNLKKIITFFFSLLLLTACSEMTIGYKFNGESEHWEAEYSYFSTEKWGKQSVDRYEFILNYKGSLEDQSSLKKIEYSFETRNKRVYESEEFTEPPSTLTFTGSSKGGAKVGKDEVINVIVKWDNFEESFELHSK